MNPLKMTEDDLHGHISILPVNAAPPLQPVPIPLKSAATSEMNGYLEAELIRFNVWKLVHGSPV